MNKIARLSKLTTVIILFMYLSGKISFNSIGQTPFTIGSTATTMSGGPFKNSTAITLTAAMFKSSGINTPLIPAAMANKKITAIGWNLTSPPTSTVTGTFRVWLKHNTANTLPFGTNFETEKTGATLFYMGTVTLPSTAGWWTITGNMGSTFAWDGTSTNHLEVLTEFVRSGSGSNAGWEGTAVYGHSGSENALYCFTNTLYDYGQYNPVMNSGGSVRPNMQFMAGDGCVTLPDAPTATTPQTYCTTGTIGNLTATGTNIRWYPSETWGNGTPTTTALTDGAHYYASQNVNGCESSDRVDVRVKDICNTKHTIVGLVLYDNTSSTPMTETTVYLKSPEGVKLDSVITDANGAYQFENLSNGTYKLSCKTSKIWGGGTPFDALQINRFYINLFVFPNKLKELAGDVSKDSKINPTDALMINRRYIRITNSFMSGDWLFEDTEINVNNADLYQDIKAICFGDVNGSYQPK